MPTPNADAIGAEHRPGPLPEVVRARNTRATLSIPANATPRNKVSTTARATGWERRVGETVAQLRPRTEWDQCGGSMGGSGGHPEEQERRHHEGHRVDRQRALEPR